MSLAAGTRLGPYEIVSPLGAGGMGEVYRARDARLGRDVALKILRADIAGDPDRRARFEREAKTVAALNHPNIVTLFEVGHADGVEYTVSELVEGEPLRALMQQGPVPVRRVVELAVQLADGMAAAHSAGIVHRDLKPENVMVTRDGRVKILDFGLARQAFPSRSGIGVPSNSIAETMTMVSPAPSSGSEAGQGVSSQYVTSPGMILGTAAYMSPEQAKGQEADYRSDQFSFGLILYEMLSGKRAFVRDSVVEMMAAIVRDEAPPLEAKIPVALRWVVERCLEKDPGQRFDSTKDLYQQLRILRDHFSEVSNSSGVFASGIETIPAEAAPGHALRGVAAWVWPLALLAGLAIGAGAMYLLEPSGLNLAKYKYTPFAVNADNPLWSPDGKMAAYSGDVGENQELFLRSLDSPTPQQLTNAMGTICPLGWSPDSSHIFYLQTTPSADAAKVLSISTVGGEPDPLWTLPDTAERYSRAVALSPDGKAGVVMLKGTDNAFDLYISDPIGSPLRRYPSSRVSSYIIFNSPQMRFSPDGKQLLLIRAGDSGTEKSWLFPWPPGSGTPHSVLDQLPHAGGTPRFAWMPDNRHIVAATSNDTDASSHLLLADMRTDLLQQITQGTDNEANPAVSPDGKSILFAEGSYDFDIVSMSLADGSTQSLIVTARLENMPAWAAKADSLVYVSNRLGTEDIWLHTRDGTDRPLVTRASFGANPPKWIYAPVLSPDGARVIFVTVGKAGDDWLWEASVAGGAPVRLVNSSDQSKAQFTGDWSPDGAQFAFHALEPDGKGSLKVVRTSGGAVPQTLVPSGVMGGVSSWSPDGNWITYMDSKAAWHLVSPDGKRNRDLGVIDTPNLGFSKDSKTAFGIRTDAGKWFLFSLDIETAKLHDIKQLDISLRPQSNLNPAIRFTLAPDGNSFAYSTAKSESSIWMLQGFAGN
jgi:eukaryotic-like serine/threonine-protein kinase